MARETGGELPSARLLLASQPISRSDHVLVQIRERRDWLGHYASRIASAGTTNPAEPVCALGGSAATDPSSAIGS